MGRGIFLIVVGLLTHSLFGMVRTTTGVEREGYYYYDDADGRTYYQQDVWVVPVWYGPGWYNGVWFNSEYDYHRWNYNHNRYNRYYRYHDYRRYDYRGREYRDGRYRSRSKKH